VRLIVRKVYRAFPELDRFSDAECEGLLRYVSRRHPIGLFFVSLGAVVLSGVFIVCGSIATMMIHLELSGPRRPSVFVEDGWFVICGIIVSVVLPSAFAFYLRRGWLLGKVQAHLSSLVCAECEYSLLGLPVVDGGITCPECGQRFDLAARGLTAADVLAKGPAPTE